MVPLMNYSDVTYIVKRHERIAQLVAITTSDLIFDQVDSLDTSDTVSYTHLTLPTTLVV